MGPAHTATNALDTGLWEQLTGHRTWGHRGVHRTLVQTRGGEDRLPSRESHAPGRRARVLGCGQLLVSAASVQRRLLQAACRALCAQHSTFFFFSSLSLKTKILP